MTDFDLEARLRTRVRAALSADDTVRAPAFDALWRSAQSPHAAQAAASGGRRAFALAAVATLAVVGFVALLLATRAPAPVDPTPDADLLLARELAASDPWRVPTDTLLDEAPAPLTRGAPPLPDFRYPLLPEERFL